MNIIEWDELEHGKAYLKHSINDGYTSMCRVLINKDGTYVVDEGCNPMLSHEFKEYVFTEISIPSRSDWATAITMKDAGFSQ